MSALTRRSMLGGSLLVYAWALNAQALAQTGAVAAKAPANTNWANYGGDLGSTRYAPLDQINAANFNDLEVAWRFKPDNFGPTPEYRLQSTPLVIDGVLYTTVGSRRDVVALDAKTGEVLWLHRIDEGERGLKAPRRLSGHGVAYWSDGKARRVLYVTPGYQLIALDAATGHYDPAFGVNGVIDLKLNDDQTIGPANDDIGLHSTPCVVKDVVIVGAAHSVGNVPEHHANAKGYVRAFDVKTGKRLWTFHTIPQKGEFGSDTWLDGVDQIGNAGVWAQISADPELNTVYLPVEMPTGDLYGGYRRGPGLFGESIVAVDLYTGVRKWHFQTVHHGLWDNDIPAAPVLMDIPMHGKVIKALAQPTKQAFLFVLDRTNGKPIWPIVEKPAPKGDAPGEWYSPTQPIPSLPAPYDRQGASEKDLIDFTPELHAKALELVKNYKIGPLYTPPSVWREDMWGTIMAPGITGGANWPGAAYDPDTHIFYVYSKTDPSAVAVFKNGDKKLTDFDYGGVLGNTPPGYTAAKSGDFQPGVLKVDGLPLFKPPGAA